MKNAQAFVSERFSYRLYAGLGAASRRKENTKYFLFKQAEKDVVRYGFPRHFRRFIDGSKTHL